jgi:SAM-dependent methyltransferase
MRIRRSFLSYILAAILSTAAIVAQEPQAKKRPDVPFVPTTEEAVQAMLKLANVKSTDTVYDLGCGDGRIVISAAKNMGAHGVGIDIDPVRIKEAKANAAKASVEKLVRFEEKDLFEADIHQATVVTIFLLPTVNLKLRPKLLKELKPGTRLVSNTFDMGDWKPDKEVTVDGGSDEDFYLSKKLFLWVIPSHKQASN